MHFLSLCQLGSKEGLQKGPNLEESFWVKDHTSSLWFQLWLELSHALGGTAPFGALHGLRAESRAPLQHRLLLMFS